MSFTGGCQCGAVRYTINADKLISYACHCTECQAQSASAFGISVPVMLDSFEIEGATRSWRRATDSGSHTRCFFCEKCGSRLYHAGENRPGMVTVKGGSLDSRAQLEPVAHIWVASMQDWMVLPEGVPQWQGQPRSNEDWMELFAWLN